MGALSFLLLPPCAFCYKTAPSIMTTKLWNLQVTHSPKPSWTWCFITSTEKELAQPLGMEPVREWAHCINSEGGRAVSLRSGWVHRELSGTAAPSLDPPLTEDTPHNTHHHMTQHPTNTPKNTPPTHHTTLQQNRQHPPTHHTTPQNTYIQYPWTHPNNSPQTHAKQILQRQG